ncbi:hypothetical protein PPK15_gp83 [Bacillus phage 000TH010]|uniref:Uncharacterized protein n=1 Tax=Bacillus phage 000TH010 TaxID=2601652 RepID=A0A5P8PHU8_9CAUD|nr:hypothetical protein PPK15_gp83 [Bacillus phage 000TH010]QFR56296.1 hypothetical protein 000TH010_83 [Bacillus phage 000TH010]
MNKQYIKSINASSAKEVYERMQEAENLGLAVAVFQLAKTGSFHNPNMFKIDLYALEEKPRQYTISIGDDLWLHTWNIDRHNILTEHTTTTNKTLACKVYNDKLGDKTTLNILYAGLSKEHPGQDIKIWEEK